MVPCSLHTSQVRIFISVNVGVLQRNKNKQHLQWNHKFIKVLKINKLHKLCSAGCRRQKVGENPKLFGTHLLAEARSYKHKQIQIKFKNMQCCWQHVLNSQRLVGLLIKLQAHKSTPSALLHYKEEDMYDGITYQPLGSRVSTPQKGHAFSR